MINDTPGIVAVLLVIEGGVFLASGWKPIRRLFDFVPVMFWIYLLPMLANSAGLIPPESRVYSAISDHFLPGCLVLLLVSSDIKAILRLGKTALVIMLAGSLSILIGGPLMVLIYKRWLPEQAWSGLGALSASWIGGSANMVAVARATGTPENVFLPMVVVDTVCSYSWMSLLILLAAFQGRYDRWNRSRTGVVEDLNRRLTACASGSQPLTLANLALMAALAAGGTFVAAHLAHWDVLPKVEGVISEGAWTILLATAIGVGLSFTPLRRLESSGASKVGYFILYFVLASIGARANLAHIAAAPLLILAGFTWLAFHGLVMVAAGRVFRAPMFLLATASQANIGGPASAPVVATIYQPALAMVGLLLAVLGNILGTPLGILCSRLCHWANSLY